LFDLYKDTVYLSLGGSVGLVYDAHIAVFRAGPEEELQYFTSDHSFLFVQNNSYFQTKGKFDDEIGTGIGIEF
jgi:hypothetical protein